MLIFHPNPHGTALYAIAKKVGKPQEVKYVGLPALKAPSEVPDEVLIIDVPFDELQTRVFPPSAILVTHGPYVIVDAKSLVYSNAFDMNVDVLNAFEDMFDVELPENADLVAHAGAYAEGDERTIKEFGDDKEIKEIAEKLKWLIGTRGFNDAVKYLASLL